MRKQHSEIIAGLTGIDKAAVENTISLLNSSCTIPFIARYRKEATKNLDEVQISLIKDQLDRLIRVEQRKETIIASIEKSGLLTKELKDEIDATYDEPALEDLYLPFKPKKKNRANTAIENGLEPLAKIITSQNNTDIDKAAIRFISDKVKNKDEAIQGACDIIAEWINENKHIRQKIRKLYSSEALIISKLKKNAPDGSEKYKDYFDFSELLRKCPSHRLLALRRGENEGILSVSISPETEKAIQIIENAFIKTACQHKEIIQKTIKDSYKRLISPSIENEFAAESKKKADEEAIKVFSENIKQLLLAPPLGQKRILAIDPGFRTGCKIVCLDNQGNLLHNETIFPHKPQEETKVASKKLVSLINQYKIDAIAIGNGTAGRETENFIKNLKPDRKVQVFVVNESGASVYSASAIAREEFPQFDVTVRGAVSIGRRLMDPLAELVKIDPKSIGVGQYQHDVDQVKLKECLDNTVVSCVNLVGVNLNTASKHLLSYVSGLGPQLANNITEYIKANGPFSCRKDLMKVPRMGEKAFEQCAGFLRISDAENPLDNSAVHPESYHVVERIAKDLNCTVRELIANNDDVKKIKKDNYVALTDKFTLDDIFDEIMKPGRDPRKIIKLFEFDQSIYKIDDLKVGMILPGIVTNITNFGAFVDVGVKQDGLVHISNLRNEFVSNPNDVVKLNQHVKVRVLEVDIARKRIQFSMKEVEQ